MVKLGLLGSNISHSKSQEMYEKILGEPVDYSLLDYPTSKEIPALEDLFAKGYLGLSITYPYKQAFFDQVTIADENVQSLNAINCLRKVGNQIEGTNTDYLAAKKLLQDFSPDQYLVIVLGSGNMARVFKRCLDHSTYSWQLLSRKTSGDLNQQDYFRLLDKADKKDLLIINCCSRDFIFSGSTPENTVFWDMNYSFPEHEKLSAKGIKYLSGLDLLYWQANFATDYWGIKRL